MFVTAQSELLQRLRSEDAVLVSVQSHRGSVPREVGAWMAVFAQSQLGTVGGGHLEWQALAQARKLLAEGQADSCVQRFALGPSLGQCCGGELLLRFEPIGQGDVTRLTQRFASERAAWPTVALFGGGHVGWALVQVLATLPLRLIWLDSRDQVFPAQTPESVLTEHSDPVQVAVADLPPDALVLVMSFSHAEDLEVVVSCLQRQRAQADLKFVGLIGSQTKWAVFSKRLLARGFTEPEISLVTCPIGVPGIKDKSPAAIAVAVAAQVLQVIGRGAA
jgi:xanthine dehydrogenase accessory factor